MKTPKRRSPLAQQVVNPTGPYKPKVIKTKPRYPSVADEFDDWYFHNHPPITRGNNEANS